MKHFAPAVAILLMLSSSCRGPSPGPATDDTFEVPSSVVLHSDIVYSNADGQPLHLDLFRPKDALNPAPAIVFIHGSRIGSRDSHHYRSFLAASYPAALNDARAAIAWLNDNAEQFRGAI